ncbi:MAG: prolyl oligopeptidase family serine peptidase [Vicinamibacterales bacterium]
MQPKGGDPRPLTDEGVYFADLRVDPTHGRVLAVREDHRQPGEPAAAIGHPGAGQRLTRRRPGVGRRLLLRPGRLPGRGTLAWLQWNHPNMPWDGTELWTAAVGPDGTLGERVKVAGGADESIFQPEWSPDGRLYFVSDRTGWWNLYRQGAGAGIEPLHPMQAEFGKPQWTFSMVTYAFFDARRLAATYVEQGRWKLAFVETDPVRWEPVNLGLDVLESIRADARALYFIGASPTTAPAVAQMTLAAMEPEVLRASTSEPIDPAWIAAPEPVTFTAGSDGREVHAFYYAPHNPDFEAPAGARPPLLVLTHGGPTSATEAVLDPEVQFWTSRGFALLDVDYSGSTGHGRAYRDRLKGQWGVLDVEDAVAGARDGGGRAGRWPTSGHPRRQRGRLTRWRR